MAGGRRLPSSLASLSFVKTCEGLLLSNSFSTNAWRKLPIYEQEWRGKCHSKQQTRGDKLIRKNNLYGNTRTGVQCSHLGIQLAQLIHPVNAKCSALILKGLKDSLFWRHFEWQFPGNINLDDSKFHVQSWKQFYEAFYSFTEQRKL